LLKRPPYHEEAAMYEAAPLDRREFTLRSALALLGGVTITISGCGGGSGSPTAPRTPSGGGAQPDTLGTVSNNHGHQATITSAELAAGGALRLDIRGQADHAHMVELSADDLQRIKSQQSVTRECTSASAHTHMVTFLRNSDPPPGSGY
jgi:hypothetical protein